MISNYKDYYENLDMQTLGVDSTQVLKVFAYDATGAEIRFIGVIFKSSFMNRIH